MKKKYFFTAFAAALLFAGFAFTACDDDDDNSAPGTKPTIKFENVIPTKNYVHNENDWPGDFQTFEKDSIRAFMAKLKKTRF